MPRGYWVWILIRSVVVAASVVAARLSVLKALFRNIKSTQIAVILSAVCATEIKYGERKTPLANGRRLSCHTLLLDDVVIDVPPESQVHRQIVRKDAEYRDIHLDPATRLYYVQVDEADMHVPKGDLQRLNRGP